jgi:hypothetical protein
VTTHEALTLGIAWGALVRTVGTENGWAVTIPSYGSDDEHAAAVAVLRTPSGVELLVTVTETRSKP